MFRLDLHTHSNGSPDGGLRLNNYRRALATGLLNQIAITDHDSVDFALQAHAELGNQIIVGEEITTTEGELIGLFLKQKVEPGLGALATAQAIKKQGGLVYVPHPFETVRKGIKQADLNAVADLVDIVETFNGRAIWQNRSDQAVAWANDHQKAMAASSDAHGKVGWGKTYSQVSELATAKTLIGLLAAGQRQTRAVGLLGSAYPKLNRLRKRVNRHD